MIFSHYIILFIVIFSTAIAEDDELSKKSTEKTLLLKLMKRYESFGVLGRPVSNSRNKVKVHFGLALIQILGLDEDTQILRTNCWSRYKWFDELLTWNESEFNGISQINLLRQNMWIPDIQLFNFADERMRVHREARVVVRSTGEMLWIPQSLFKSSCSVEIIYFPFDVQICRLDFGSWTYDITQLELHWWGPFYTDLPNDTMPYVDFKEYLVNNEWFTDGELEKVYSGETGKKQIRSVRFLRFQNITDGDEIKTKSYHVLRYRIRLRRNHSFYVFILIIPCVLLSLLVNIVFWLPTESPAKLLLGMNTFVAFFILLLLLKSSIPTAVKTFPLIGSFFCLNMIMITLSTFLVTVVINFYVRGDRKGPMPNSVRKIMIDRIGRILFVSQFIPLPPPQPPVNRNAYVTQSPGGRLHHKLCVPELASNKFMISDTPHTETSTSQHVNRRSSSNRCYPQPEFISSNKNEILYSRNNVHRPLSHNRHNAGLNNIQHQGICDPQHSPLMVHNGTSSIEKDVSEISRYVRQYIGKQKETQRKNQLTMEWRTLGLVLDRLFWIFYVSTIMISVIIGIPTKEALSKMEEEALDPNLVII